MDASSHTTQDQALAHRAYDLARATFEHEFGRPSFRATEDREWKRLRSTGTRLWLDTGDMEEATRLWNPDFEALTTNNTLLNREVQKGIYDDYLTRTAADLRASVPDLPTDRLVLEVAFVLNARHGLRLVERFDAHVSVELHTALADDLERTVEYGLRYYAICPERFYIKVPLTPAGLLAARRLTREGVPINLTLGFSARHNYMAALVADPAFVNVFMGRLGAFVADNGLGSGKNVGEKAALACQRALLKLRARGRAQSLLIGASMRDGKQVAALAGLDVFTMPSKVAQQYRTSPAPHLPAKLRRDPGVNTARGVTLEDFDAGSLWDVSPTFIDTVDDLLGLDIDAMTPQELQTHFRLAGFAGFLPSWSDADIKTVARDGKIPVYATWRERLRAGDVALDALMNISALQSFASDQKALDDRIRSLI